MHCSPSSACRTCVTPRATVSLVERQVEVLRDRNQALERKLAELVDVARANDALADRIHRLSQRLIRARTLPRDHQCPRDEPARGFRCAQLGAALVHGAGSGARGAQPAASSRRRIPPTRVIKTFESLLQSGKPRCGQIRDTQRDFPLRQGFHRDRLRRARAARRQGSAGPAGDRRKRCGPLPPGHEHGVPDAHRRAARECLDALRTRAGRASDRERVDRALRLAPEARAAHERSYGRGLPRRHRAARRLLRRAQDRALQRGRRCAGAHLRRHGSRAGSLRAQHPAAALGAAHVLRVPGARGLERAQSGASTCARRSRKSACRRRSMRTRWAGCWPFAPTIRCLRATRPSWSSSIPRGCA